MSGAPVGSFFTVEIDGKEKRHLIKTNVFSDKTIERLRTVLITRRREKRRETLEDFGKWGRDLPKAAQEAFAQGILADAKSDLEVSAQQALEFVETFDREAIATLLSCCVDEIDSVEEAMEVMDAYGDVVELFEKVMEVAFGVTEAVKNSRRRPAKAQAK